MHSLSSAGGYCNSTSASIDLHRPSGLALASGTDHSVSAADPSFPGPFYIPAEGNAAIIGPTDSDLFSGSSHLNNFSQGNHFDEFDCESEEGPETWAEELPAKQVPSRSSSKRSRAAEVHNLSEKRRRSRINEKMKALQNLIPNSNKTDKASMLDEAIEYLKQLQLQVQMLSIRNGISLHPLCLPGVPQPVQLSQMRMGLSEANVSNNLDTSAPLPLNPETSARTILSPPNKSPSPGQLTVPAMLNVINSTTPLGLDSSVQSTLGPFYFRTSEKEICREDRLPHRQLNVHHSESNSSGALSALPFPFDGQASDIKDNSTSEAGMLAREQSEMMHIKNDERNRTLSQHFNCPQERSSLRDDTILRRKDF